MNHNFGYAANGTTDVSDDTNNTHRWIATKSAIDFPVYINPYLDQKCLKVTVPGMTSSELAGWSMDVYNWESETPQSKYDDVTVTGEQQFSNDVTAIKLQFNKINMDVITAEEIAKFDDAYVEFWPLSQSNG